jgi:hypothetical protein
MPTPHRSTYKDRLTITIGGLFVLGIILAGWIPQSCPLIRQWLSSCPADKSIMHYGSYEEQENARVPHQVIEKDFVDFETEAQDYRKTTEVKFSYKGDLSHQIAHLGIRVGNQVQRLALISHPLLVSLDWPRYTTNLPNETMYQRNETFETVDALHANLPPAKSLAVDEVIAKEWNLSSDHYTALESLTSLDGIDYIVTTFKPPLLDGTWRFYDQTFDTTDAFIDSEKHLNWMIFLPDVKAGKEPFRMTTVHIDYRAVK